MNWLTERKTTMNMKTTFQTVSEWVKSGNLATGFYLIENPVCHETAKAIGVSAQKINSMGNLKPAMCFFPKSKLFKVANDFYQNGPVTMILIPEWLFSAKLAEGYEFGG